jgi:hypothetical protein
MLFNLLGLLLNRLPRLSGVRGVLDLKGFAQVLEQEKKTGLLFAQTKSQSGIIFFLGGKMGSAQTQTLVDDAAKNEMVDWAVEKMWFVDTAPNPPEPVTAFLLNREVGKANRGRGGNGLDDSNS